MESRQQQQWMASHPDYVGVAMTATGQPSQFLMQAIQKDPSVGEYLQRNWNPSVAYALAKQEQLLSQATAAPAPVPPAPRIPNAMDQIRRAQAAPQSISTAQGQGQMDKANYVASLTPEQFEQHYQNLVNGLGFTASSTSQ